MRYNVKAEAQILFRPRGSLIPTNHDQEWAVIITCLCINPPTACEQAVQFHTYALLHQFTITLSFSYSALISQFDKDIFYNTV